VSRRSSTVSNSVMAKFPPEGNKQNIRFE